MEGRAARFAEQAFRTQIHRCAEELKMPYLSSIERFGYETGYREGREAGRQEGRQQGREEALQEWIDLALDCF